MNYFDLICQSMEAELLSKFGVQAGNYEKMLISLCAPRVLNGERYIWKRTNEGKFQIKFTQDEYSYCKI